MARRPWRGSAGRGWRCRACRRVEAEPAKHSTLAATSALALAGSIWPNSAGSPLATVPGITPTLGRRADTPRNGRVSKRLSLTIGRRLCLAAVGNDLRLRGEGNGTLGGGRGGIGQVALRDASQKGAASRRR